MCHIFLKVINLTKIKKWHVFGFFFSIVAGVLLHFAYDISGQMQVVGWFSAVNESVWEHLKLIFFPFALWTLLEYAVYGKAEIDFFAVKITAVLSAMAFVVVFFYTYTGILGFNLFWMDILSFVGGVFLGQNVSFRLLNASARGDYHDNIKGILTFMLLATCFIVWTDTPPELGIFWG